jgi:hypothetical protein
MNRWIYFCLCFILCASASAQVKIQTQSDSTIESFINAENAAAQSAPASQRTDDQALQAAIQRQVLQHRIAVESYNQRVYEWQLFNSKIIFWLVVFLVISGVALSGFQFYKDHLAQLKYHELTEKLTTRAEKQQPETIAESLSLEANLKGIKFNSNIIGMMILVVSLLFFFLYLKYVYPIQ